MIFNVLRFVNHKKRKASFTILLYIPFQQLIRNQKYVDILSLEQLKKIVQPFMLRRLKQDVLKELPEKVETIVYSKMEPKGGKLREHQHLAAALYYIAN